MIIWQLLAFLLWGIIAFIAGGFYGYLTKEKEEKEEK